MTIEADEVADMSKKLAIVIAAVLCVCMIAGCFLEKKEEEPKQEGPVILDSTPGLEDIEEEEEPVVTAGEPVAIMYTAPDASVTTPEGYEQITPDKDAVLGSLEYPVYGYTDSQGLTRYIVWGQPVDEAGTASGDAAWYVLIVRTVDKGAEGKKLYVFRDAYDQKGLLPAEAVVAEEEDNPKQIGFTVYSVEAADLSGNYSRTYYAYADIYDIASPGMAESGWQQVVVASENVPEDAYDRLIKGQKVYIKGDGYNGISEIGASMTIKPDFSKDTVSVNTWDIVAALSGETLQSEDSVAELIISGETTENLNPEEKEEVKPEEKKEEAEKEEDSSKKAEEDSDENIDKHEHDWVKQDETAATCESDGSITYKCSICGKEKTEIIKATGHDWTEEPGGTEATCVAEGTKTYKCKNCGQPKTETIPAKGHSYKWVIESSVHYQECTVCGDMTKPAPHSFVDGKCTACGYEAKG